MGQQVCRTILSKEALAEIISTQLEIVKVGVDMYAVMNLVVDQLVELTGASGAIVELVECDEMVYRAVSGVARNQLGLRLKRATSLSGLCVEKGEVLQCVDSETDERVDREACRKVGLRSMLVAPLVYSDTVIGVLKILSPEPNFFEDQHVCILETLSQLVAASMYHAEKYEISELYRKATHDALTGLANRALFYDRLRQSLALAARRKTRVGVLNIDMDGLKAINDTYGHKAGDLAISEFAARMQQSMRDADTVARLGGDEFGVVLSDINDEKSIDIAVGRIRSQTTGPLSFDDTTLKLEASVGAAVFPDDAHEIESLLEAADCRMYDNKRRRKAASGKDDER